MFHPRFTYRALAITLAAAFAVSAAAVTFVTAQDQPAIRPRRTDDPQQQPTATPKPTPKGQQGAEITEDEVVRVETNLTNILFTAADKNRRFITDLQRGDIRVSEDGQPQEIFTFAHQVDLPLSLAILIDVSASEERTLPVEKDAAKAFVDTVIRPDKDEAAIVSFTGEATLEQGLTGNVARARRALDRVEFVPPSGYIGHGQVAGGTPPISGTNQGIAGSTAIWDAIWVVSDEVLTQTSDKTRRAIILMTDGEDTSSKKHWPEAVDRAIKADAVIYAVGIGDQYFGGVNEGILRKVTEKTGGRAFFPRNQTDLRVAFEQIQQELRSQYLVAYSSTNKARDGSYRKVTIDLVNPDLRSRNLRLTYRQGYFAKN
jgi:VWFA-related protein